MTVADEIVADVKALQNAGGAKEDFWVGEDELRAIVDRRIGQRTKGNYLGAPAIFALDMACVEINNAFGDYGCYLVGSVLDRPTFRDVDVRFIMADDAFRAMFPDAAIATASWELNSRWRLINVSIAKYLASLTGLNIDFQIQPMTHANKLFPNERRHPLGLRVIGSDA